MTIITPSAREISAVGAPYDVEAVRADFPILAEKVHGKPLVYLDNAASAQKPKVVLDALQRAYSEEYANVHRGLHFHQLLGERHAAEVKAGNLREAGHALLGEELHAAAGRAA